ncbi:hypothetical protein EAG18_10605 [Pseudoalteromonas sp. J010]|uniref:transporter substrate-binding domain-containing protein n=1 Tax=Pseudoalteromonas sp. J010 TaxID=998465 RepID=UPI000F654BEE|nr:transporter substrate-binding domain-containing protein [Pseudoalteromonas sp. J010]RRS08641.1 hypothetical protein EAG18_10605 [Pseudoalteromonas sp. J010]
MKWLILTLSLLWLPAVAQEARVIRISIGADPYIVELLTLALSYEQTPSKIVSVRNVVSQARAIRLLGKKSGVDVSWLVTNSQREKAARAIRIPLVKGLLGYRIPLVHRDNRHALSAIRYIGDLRSFTFGLRSDWPDHEIFEQNGLHVMSFSQEQSGYEMLAKKRFDILPSDFVSIESALSDPRLHADHYVAFYYPSAVYFFVSHDDQLLYEQLKKGLKRALQDGKFEALFLKHFSSRVKALDLENKTIIELSNPTLPPSAPLEIPHYWHTQGK